MYREFQFNWGHTESARLVSGPIWHHEDGFKDPLEALASFRAAIQAMYISQGCDDHKRHPHRFCPECGKESVKLSAKDSSIMIWFDDLWNISVDDIGDHLSEMEEGGWITDETLARTDATAIVYGMNFYLGEVEGRLSIDAGKFQWSGDTGELREYNL